MKSFSKPLTLIPFYQFFLLPTLQKGRYLSVLTVCLFFFVFGYQISSASDLRFDHFDVDDGLSHNTITDILQTPDGYLWIATEDGLNRYNGYEFEVFRHDPSDSSSIGDNYVHDLFLDSDGSLWILTQKVGLIHYVGDDRFVNYYHNPADSTSLRYNSVTFVYEDSKKQFWVGFYYPYGGQGMDRFDRETGQFFHYCHSENDSTSLSHNRVSDIFEDSNGDLYVATGKGLDLWDPNSGTFSCVEAPESLHNKAGALKMMEDRSNRIWVGSHAGLFLFDRITETFQSFVIQDLDLPNHSVLPLLEDSNGYCWFRVGKHGLLKIDSNLNPTLYKTAFGNTALPVFTYGAVLQLIEDRSGGIWAAIQGGGLNQYNPETDSFVSHRHDKSRPHSLSENIVVRLLEDREGHMWIGTLGSGLAKLDRRKNLFTHLLPGSTPDSELENLGINSFIEYGDDNFLIGTSDGGLNILKNQTGTINYYIPESGPLKDILPTNLSCLYNDKKNKIWVGTYTNGLIRYHTETGQIRRFPRSSSFMPTGYVRQVINDHHGNIWIAGREAGLYRIDANTDSLERVGAKDAHPDSLFLGGVFSVFCDRTNQIWIGTSRGLCSYDPVSEEAKWYRHDPANPGSLSNNSVFTVYESRDGTFWVGTFHGGLNRLDNDTGNFKSYRIKDGLPNDIVYRILEDSSGQLWISTNNKLCSFNPETESFFHFDKASGLPSNAFNSRPALKASDGRMFFGTQNGAFAFYPDSIKPDSLKPNVYVKSCRVIRQEEESLISLNSNRKLQLSYRDRVFSFEFIALYFHQTEKIRYEYKLEGLHDTWIQNGNSRQAVFTGIPPGSYRFIVRAANPYNVRGEVEMPVELTITPPFWQRGWFRFLLLTIFFSSVYSVYRFRLDHFKRIEKIRLRIAGDLHDEIGSNLGSIVMLSRMIDRPSLSENKRHAYLETIGLTATRTAESMRDIVWFINPENDSAERIEQRLRDFVSRILPDLNVQLELQPGALHDGLTLMVKRNVYLIIKESITNIARHANATEVRIRLNHTQALLKLEIIDNGRGFDRNNITTSTGTESMQKRSLEIGATLNVKSSPGNGTSIILEVPS